MATRHMIGGFKLMVTGGGPTKGVATVRVHPDDFEAAKKLFCPSRLKDNLSTTTEADPAVAERLLVLAKKIHQKVLSNQKLVNALVGGKSKSTHGSNGGSETGSGSGSGSA